MVPIFVGCLLNMLGVRHGKKGESLKEHKLKTSEQTHWNVKYLSIRGGVGVLGINVGEVANKVQGEPRIT